MFDLSQSTAQWTVGGVLVAALVMFVWGKWRYDLVALMALLVLTVVGIVPADGAFSGFGHPAVITVAAVLIVSAGLQSAGVIDLLGARIKGLSKRPTVQVLAMTALVALFSSFMNNVGALAVLMPIAIHLARSSDRSPSYILMPLAFGSLLGGMTTLIGTPPNIIIATFRAELNAEPFGMFAFAPVGLGVAVCGVLFIGLVGWRLIPQRDVRSSTEALFEIEQYVAELRVPEESKALDMTLGEVRMAVDDAELIVLGLARGKQRVAMPGYSHKLQVDDILLIEGDAESIEALSKATGMELVGDQDLRDELMKTKDVIVMEAIVMPESALEGRPVARLQLGRRYGLNLLGVARQGRRLKQRLREIRLQAGDVLLLQGDREAIGEAIQTLGLLPLAERGLQIGQPRQVALAVGLFGAALLSVMLGWMAVQVAFALCAAMLVITGVLSLRQVYQNVDWPIIVLLGAMIPVGTALETTGGAALIADALLNLSRNMPAAATVVVILVGTMLLSDLINNAAAAVLMAPIGIQVARGMEAAADPFLMAVAVGASCAFLTPIGHQSNTLVLGPGGYLFRDYWPMGSILQIIIVLVAVPLILWWWPLF